MLPQQIDAVFENGVFRPLQPVQLPEHHRVTVLLPATENSSPVEKHLQALIAHLSMPKSWIDEQIEGPTDECKRYSLQVVRRWFLAYGLIPYKITISKDGGVFAAYKNPHNNRILRIEVDNDLDVVAVVSDGEAILDSGLLEGDDREQSLLGSFDPPLA
jgi:predicted DNA-binding antitoxin AbrB/MazE fold protein